MAYQGLLWSIYTLPSVTAIRIPSVKSNATSLSNGNTTFENLVEEVIDLFTEWWQPYVLDRSNFQTVRVFHTYEHDRPLPPILDMEKDIELNVEFKDQNDTDLIWNIAYHVNDFEPEEQRHLNPYQQNYPIWNFQDDLRGSMFADALDFLRGHYGMEYNECRVTLPPKDPFREGQRPLEVMWLCYTGVDWPRDRVYVVTTSMAAWGNFTMDDLGLERPSQRYSSCTTPTERATGNTTHVKGNSVCQVATS